MKNILYLSIIILVFSCEQKPSEIDQKLFEEETYFHKNSIISNDINIKRIHESVRARGYKPDEKILFDKLLSFERIFLKMNENIHNEDSFKKFIPLYEKQFDFFDSLFQKWNIRSNNRRNDYDLIFKKPSWKKSQLFKNQFRENHYHILYNCSRMFGANQLKFSSIETNLNAKKYNYGDTIYGRIFLSDYHYPFLPKVIINGNLVEDYKYSQIIDSTQKQVLDIDVSYFNTVQKDTTFKVHVNYKINGI